MSGWAFTAFLIDVITRKIVGWKVASEMTTYVVEAAIANAIDYRKRSGVIDLGALIHHGDAFTPDHAEQLHYDRMRTLNPEETLTI